METYRKRMGPVIDVSPGPLAALACALEASARKPGNVHPGASFADGSYLDFLLSARAIAGPLDRVGRSGVGGAILAAVEATRRVAPGNTNLGMVLLLAPLAVVPADEEIRGGVARVLAGLTVDDARAAYRAIRLAAPGGLGRAEDQDVEAEPTVTLLEAMHLAAGRDAIARQYATDYEDVFDVVLPALVEALEKHGETAPAIVAAHVATMARLPDTLIARKRGNAVAAEAMRRAAEALSGASTLESLDIWLRADGHARNPGATADLVAAALFLALRGGTIDPVKPHRRPAGTAPLAATSYSVRVTKDTLVFSAGHFITYNGDQCERVHGHNYRVAVEVRDALDENRYVFDFIALRDLTKALCDELDHRMLLPADSPLIALEADGPNVLARFGDRHWSFPRVECAVLPVANTTAELLADYLNASLRAAIAARGLAVPSVVVVEVEECFGQSATAEWRRMPSQP